jgi:hypothetical protein
MSNEHDPKASSELGPGPSLWTTIRVFFRFPSPRSFLIAVTLLISFRLWLGGFTWWDLAVVPLILALEPFVEWLIHVYILHFKPKHFLGRVLDLQVAQFHRAHHRDPWKLDVVFIPRRAGYVGLVLLMAGWYSVMPTLPLFTTAVLGSVLMAFAYEWIHYLTHTAYRPRTRLYRHLWRLHRLHHFKNEHYWQGVTTHLADRVLGTLPDQKQVATSPTCRTLGVE